MKSWDDRTDNLLPEENDRQHKELVTFLRKAYQAHPDLSHEEHVQILARVRGRLLQTEQALSMNDEVPLYPLESANPSSFKNASIFSPSHRRKRFGETVNVLVAVLVVGVLIGSSLLLFTHRLSQRDGGPGAFRNIPSVTVISSVAGLAMSISLTVGPYFLSEMLGADIALTNHTRSTYYVGPPFGEDFCGYWPGVVVTGGSKPDYNIPIATDHSCPAGAIHNTSLRPGQTLTVHTYMPLTSSGKQTLAAETAFYDSSSQVSDSSLIPVSLPLEKRWPTVQIDVSPTIPSARKLSYEINGSEIVVNTPNGTPSHLVYLYGVSCQDNNGTDVTGNYRWESVSTNQVNKPECPGKNEHWKFAFGIPGYAVVMGAYSFA